MQAAKWLKWKIGAVCAALLVAAFQLVRTSPQFELQLAQEAAARHTATDTPAFEQRQDDAVMEEWQSAGSGGERQTQRGGRRFSRRGEGGSGFASPNGGGGSETRTSRS
ncbi:hypothetical protein [Paenibacillus silvisoli]|uniref:hypothetical protein n=1 Tax=Paenibacillus silvisoli TaxID=3110539 RepID=UPI0028064FA7|nr:hypothetical protein [Paenibacillus silvisoli]